VRTTSATSAGSADSVLGDVTKPVATPTPKPKPGSTGR